jgi:hypothetical protein
MKWQSHHIITTSLPGCRTAFLRRILVLDRQNASDLMVISMDLFSYSAVSLLFNLEAARQGRSMLFSDEQKLLFEGRKKGFA